MKKGGIITAIIIIVISISIFLGVGSITDRLPQPKFGDSVTATPLVVC